MSRPVRVLFSCTGVGIFNRGIESFFREAFDGLKKTPGLECRLLKGAGNDTADEKRVFCLPRTGRVAKWAGGLIRRDAYVAEQLSSFPAVAWQIRRFNPEVVFYSDANLGFQLYFRRKWMGVPFRLLFSNGGPIHAPFVRTDFVHQVAPFYQAEALAAGEPAGKHFMVPYGVRVPASPLADTNAKLQLREKLGLPLHRPIVLSVGWVSRQHKRMHYVIEELARLPEPRPFLQLLGSMDETSTEIVDMGNRLLGPQNFSARSVPYAEVGDYYRTSDCFVLASLKEGFGRVFLEALMYGLPVIAHRHPVMEFVVGDAGMLGDLNKPDTLSGLLKVQLKTSAVETLARQRWQSVRDRFSWDNLAPKYAEMFAAVAA